MLVFRRTSPDTMSQNANLLGTLRNCDIDGYKTFPTVKKNGFFFPFMINYAMQFLFCFNATIQLARTSHFAVENSLAEKFHSRMIENPGMPVP